MKHYPLATLFTLLLFKSFSYGQAYSDTTIPVIAQYELGDELIYEYKTVEETTTNGTTSSQTSTYDVKMTITDSTANSFEILLESSNWQSEMKNDGMEKEITQLAASIPSQYHTDASGMFVRIDTSEERQAMVNTVYTQFLTKKEKQSREIMDAASKESILKMFQNKVHDSFWMQNINIHHYFYGERLNQNKNIETMKYFPHGIVNMQIPSEQTVKVLKVDNENSSVHLRMEAKIKEEDSRKLVHDYIIEKLKTLGIEDIVTHKMEDIPSMQIIEQLDCIFNISTGYITEGVYQLIEELDGTTKLKIVEYSLKE